MADNKVVKTIMEAATLTGLAAGIGWAAKNVSKHSFTQDPGNSLMNYVKFTALMAGSIALKKYLEDQKILANNVELILLFILNNQVKKNNLHRFNTVLQLLLLMASIAMMIGVAVLNAVKLYNQTAHRDQQLMLGQPKAKNKAR